MTPDAYVVELPGSGMVSVPPQFRELITDLVSVNASLRAGDVLDRLKQGQTVVVTSGAFEDLRILVWYVMRFKESLVSRPGKEATASERMERQDRIREKIFRLMVVVHGECLMGIDDHPSMEGLDDWASWDKPGEGACLVPARRVMRILTDMKRSREGIHIRVLDANIVVFPHVYVPFDQSVIDLLDGRLEIGSRDSVLDMGTGTGILALVAAQRGAGRVLATDVLDQAVRNARENVRRLGLDSVVEVRGPSDLFDGIDEAFDVILFNPPWIRGDARSVYEGALYDPDGDVISRFLSGAGAHLRDGGRIYLIYSDISESTGYESISCLMEMIDRCGLAIDHDSWTGRRSRVTGSRERVHLYEIVKKGN